MKWIEVQVSTTAEAEEAITNFMHELGAGGVVINDPNDIKALAEESNWDFIEPSLFDDSNAVKISAYFPVLSDTTDKISLLRDRALELKKFGLDTGNLDIKVSEVDETDWENNWKQYYKPTKIGNKIVIKPTWEEYIPENDEIIIELDPGMAFGTGTHETTRMCIEFLERIIKPDDIVFDVGCGSGILSIVSAKLNAKEVYGADIDDIAIKVAGENAALNNLKNVRIFKSDLLNDFAGKADVIVSNIIADVIIKIAEDVHSYLKDSGAFISSGIIKDRKDEVLNILKEYFEIIDIMEDGEWVAILSRKK